MTPRPLPARRPRALLRPSAILLALALAACGRGAPTAGEPSGEGQAPTAAATPTASNDAAGLAVVDPHHAAHPGWRDLGSIALGEVATHVVELENREGRPLVIRAVRAGCACMVPSLAYRNEAGELVQGDTRSSDDVLTLPTGAVAELTLRIDSRRAPVMNQPKRVNVRLVSDSDTDPYLTIEAQFTVETPFQLAPEVLDFGQVAEHGAAVAAVRLIPLKEVEAVAVVETPPGVQVVLEPTVNLGETAWELHGTVLPPIEPGLVESTVTVSTRNADGSEAPPYEVPVRVTGVPDIQVVPARLVLRPPTPSEPPAAEVEVRCNLQGQRLRLFDPRAAGPGADLMAVDLLPTTPDASGRSPVWTVRVITTGELPSAEDGIPLAGTLTVATDDPSVPELEIPWLHLERGGAN